MSSTTATPAPTVPSPSAVGEALARLERAFPSPAVAEALARHEAAARTIRELSASTAWMAPAEFDRLLCVQDEMAMCRCQLAAAGQLHLIEVA